MFSFINKNYDWFKWYRRIRFPILIPLPKGVILFKEVNCILVCGRTKDKQTFRNILSSCKTRYSPESNRNNREVLSFFKEVFHFCLINSSSKTKTQATWPRYATFSFLCCVPRRWSSMLFGKRNDILNASEMKTGTSSTGNVLIESICSNDRIRYSGALCHCKFRFRSHCAF